MHAGLGSGYVQKVVTSGAGLKSNACSEMFTVLDARAVPLCCWNSLVCLPSAADPFPDTEAGRLCKRPRMKASASLR